MSSIPSSTFKLQHSPSFWTGTLGVLEYEVRRALTPLRIIVWIGMALFPVFLVTTVSYLVHQNIPSQRDSQIGFTMLLSVLLPEVVTVLGMLLWATPIVNSEIESQSWVYSVVRPGARQSMLVGKYAVAVLWTASCSCFSATVCVPITGMNDQLNAWFILCAMSLLSAAAHGALFMLIGTLFHKRAMVIAFAYAVIVEGFLGWLPAVINKFTIAYRLRSIIFQWMELKLGDMFSSQDFVSKDVSIAEHIAVTLLAIMVLLLVTRWRLQRSQYSMQSDFA